MSDGNSNGAGDEMSVLPFDDGSAGRIIRREWHDGRWFFSVVDVVAALTDSDATRQYWYDMKRRIQDEGFRELSAKCLQLKMRSPLDGKKYATDAADTETMLRITMSIPSPKAEPMRQWLAQVGAQRLEEVAAELDENQRRLLLRGDVAERNRSLMATAGNRWRRWLSNQTRLCDLPGLGLQGAIRRGDRQRYRRPEGAGKGSAYSRPYGQH